MLVFLLLTGEKQRKMTSVIVLGSNSPAFSVPANRHGYAGATAKLCQQYEKWVAQLSEEDLFRLSLQETEPKKSLPIAPIRPSQKNQQKSNFIDLSDGELFRRSLGETEPKKSLSTNNLGDVSHEISLVHGIEKPRSRKYNLQPFLTERPQRQQLSCLTDISDAELFRRCMLEPEPVKCLGILSAPQSKQPLSDKLACPADKDFFCRCMMEAEPRKGLPATRLPPTKI